MNVEFERPIEDTLDHDEPLGGIPVVKWSPGNRGSDDPESRDDGNSTGSSPRRGRPPGSGAGEGQQSAKRGRKSNAAKVADGEAARDRIRGRLREQLSLVTVVCFAKYGGWRGKKWEKVNGFLAQKIEECYYIDDEAAETVADPAAHFIARHVPIDKLEAVSDTLDPINLVAAVHSLLQAMEQREKRLILSYSEQRMKAQRVHTDRASEMSGIGHVDDPITEPDVGAHIFQGA
jgi:hypothetical protein